MARRIDGLRNRKGRNETRSKLRVESLDYHEGLSANQIKIILREFKLSDRIKQFNEWMYGQTCPVIQRSNRRTGKSEQTGGIYEYDLFRWIENQKKGTPLIWD